MKYVPKPNAFSIPVRVYYEDTDAGGVVYYANYLKFFERCRSEWMRFAGHDQSQLASDAGIGFVARKVSCEYLKPARLDDQLTVGLEVEKLTRVRVIFRQHVRCADQELVTGTVEIACVNMATMKPAPIPEFLHCKLEALK
ncbi:MAG: tol-pal system-associated acyl-CoA thioesterase [Azonexus sp.]|nr:tol-pal system-associated acyl-CoA thioesterase [Azonexus sp.]MDP3636826.1 tol-pal system-associated acyl-CoA thioesterase [Azonexus sp.]MDZ4315078.1 tol-pal system-associated acyl-CoA thioesterase [Azonexus sp.]